MDHAVVVEDSDHRSGRDEEREPARREHDSLVEGIGADLFNPGFVLRHLLASWFCEPQAGTLAVHEVVYIGVREDGWPSSRRLGRYLQHASGNPETDDRDDDQPEASSRRDLNKDPRITQGRAREY